MMSDKKKSVYELALHESLNIDRGMINVMRVPSGWIYSYWNEKKGELENPVFVPLASSDKILRGSQGGIV